MAVTEKSPEAFRTISEVARWLDTPAHVLRFWESRFPQIAPVKGAGGRRYYRPEDMRLLGGIKRLLHEEGQPIKAVQEQLDRDGLDSVSRLSPDLPTAPAATESPRPAPVYDMSAPPQDSREERGPPIGFFFDDTGAGGPPPRAAPARDPAPRDTGAAMEPGAEEHAPAGPPPPALGPTDGIPADPADPDQTEALRALGPQIAAWLRGADMRVGGSGLRAAVVRLEAIRRRIAAA